MTKKQTSVQSLEKTTNKPQIRPQSSNFYSVPVNVIEQPPQYFTISQSENTRTNKPKYDLIQHFNSLLTDQNMQDVIKLITSPDNTSSIYLRPSQGLRPQSAVKKVDAPKQSKHTPQRVSSAKAYGEQVNLKFLKKVKGMTNPIIIKGTKY